MMDTLAEEMMKKNAGFQISETFRIPALLWVDDVLSCTEGETNQESTLNDVAEFAVKHRLQWGAAKCKVMRVGHHGKYKEKTWSLGAKTITETKSYRYLGDIITNDGKNKENIEARKTKTKATTININAVAATEVLRMVETPTLLQLHEKITVPGLIANAESWNLLKGEKEEINKIEQQALKNLFDLPVHTPTPAILFTFGTIFTHLRVEQRRLMYLHRMLKRQESHWTNKILLRLETLDIGWSKSIKNTLRELDLPTDFSSIKSQTRRAWKNLVTEKIEMRNTGLLIKECFKKENGQNRAKTKTAHIIEHLRDDGYRRNANAEIMRCNRQDAKTIIIARFRMLECGANFKGSLKFTCQTCNLLDDENHRINTCRKYRSMNMYDSVIKANFDDVFSTDLTVVKQIIAVIQRIWNTQSAHGTMRSVTDDVS